MCKFVKSPSDQGTRVTWVWFIGEVCQGTIVRESIWYHVRFNNESNNEIIKMNWTRFQKGVEFEIYIHKKLLDCSTYSILWAPWAFARLVCLAPWASWAFACLICLIPWTLWALARYHKYAMSSCFSSHLGVLVTLNFPSSFSSREIIFLSLSWIMLKQRKTSSQRKCNLLKALDIDALAMRSCSHCSRLEKTCRIVDDSNKCLECIRLDYTCDLAPLDIYRYRRLKEQRKKLKAKLHATIAKQQRLIRQLKFVENEQQTMMNAKLQNIEELNQEERALALLKSFIDILSKQMILSNISSDWFLTSLDLPFETFSTLLNNLWNFFLIFMCFSK